ncbi:hypothetical protein ACFL0U_01350 [Pseudomonadota bacterium]
MLKHDEKGELRVIVVKNRKEYNGNVAECIITAQRDLAVQQKKAIQQTIFKIIKDGKFPIVQNAVEPFSDNDIRYYTIVPYRKYLTKLRKEALKLKSIPVNKNTFVT